jgi:predicted DCC family thiol-disulfide oxidoreductase YuxK
VSGSDGGFLVLIDGECTLCQATGMWVNLRDKKRRFRFHALQSEEGRELLEKHGLATDDYDTMVLIENDRAYTRSTAALRIAKRLRIPWPMLYGFIIIPRPLRDAVYRFVAKNRHKIRLRRKTPE